MQLKSRLLLFFVGIALFGLVLISVVSYNSAIEYGDNFEKEELEEVSEVIVGMLRTQEELESILELVRGIRIDHLGIYLVDARNNIHAHGGKFNFIKKDIAIYLAQGIMDEELNFGHGLPVSEVDFYWKKSLIPGTPYTLVLIEEFSEERIANVINIFGAPLLVVGIVILWISIWGALILASLFKKLDQQKISLEIVKNKALQANHAKSDFLANMSHEIRTPLTAILGFSETLLQKDLSEEDSYNAVRTIMRNGRHLINLINDILDLSRIEANKLKIEHVNFSPVKLMADLESMVKIQAQSKNINIDVKYIFPIPEEINSDPLRLRQILYNLCSNAIKFTEEGYIVITVGCKPDSQEMYFEVADTGIGVKKEAVEEIFNRFSQADASITREYGGTGLGLALSRKLAEKLGGSLSMESEYGVGSRFTATIDCGVLDNTKFLRNKDEIPRIKISALLTPPSLSGRVLLVEDNLDNQRLLSLLIRKTGVEFFIASNGEQAVEMGLNTGFDLIFMDMQMPVMDGVEAVKLLRHQKYNKPIIALTANVMSESKEICISIGCNDFLSKPVDRNRLYEVMSEYLRVAADTVEGNATMLDPIQSPLMDDPALAEIVLLFTNELGKKCANIEDALDKQDWDVLRDIFHQLKGSGGGIGFPMVTEIAAKIGIEIREQKYHLMRESIKEFYLICDRINAGAEQTRKESNG